MKHELLIGFAPCDCANSPIWDTMALYRSDKANKIPSTCWISIKLDSAHLMHVKTSNIDVGLTCVCVAWC